MKKLFLIVLIGLSLSACKLDLDIATIREACSVLEAAGVNRNFRFSPHELSAMTREHKIIIKNIKDWYKGSCT